VKKKKKRSDKMDFREAAAGLGDAMTVDDQPGIEYYRGYLAGLQYATAPEHSQAEEVEAYLRWNDKPGNLRSGYRAAINYVRNSGPVPHKPRVKVEPKPDPETERKNRRKRVSAILVKKRSQL
jgi:hypothetical protein